MINRYIVFNDVHVPFHDTRALKLVYNIIKDLQLNVIINGDFLDAFSLNTHQPKDPLVSASLHDEFYAGFLLLKELRDLIPDKSIHYAMGNHENRLERFVIKNCPAFMSLLSVDKMLKLDRLNITWHEYNKPRQIEKTNLYTFHSPPSYGENGARTSLLKKPNASFIYGCTHREQHATSTDAHGNVHSVWFNGWLGSLDETSEHERVFNYAKGHSNWQKCFIIVTVIDEIEFHVQQVRINNYTAVVDGYLYKD